MNLQILSAGLGTRLKPITEKIPKPALPILNVPMFFYSLHYFDKKNFNNIVVNTFHLENELQKTLSKFDPDLKFVSDGKEVLGTGGGIESVRPSLEGDDYFWVANGDCVFLSDDNFVELAEKNHKLKKPIATLVVMEHPDVGTKFGGVWVDNEDRVLDIGKTKPANATKGYHFTGFRILSDEIFKFLPQGPSELFDSLKTAMREGHQVHIYKTTGHFFETGNQKDFLDCTKSVLRFLKEKRYSNFLTSLLKKYTPESRLNDLSIDLKLPPHDNLEYLFVDKNFTLFNDCTLEGFLVVGKNAVIKERCSLKNVVILDDQIIAENSEISDTIIF
ncbi:MAG: NDP-sugar synthase [Bdellovibrionota bacterium]